MAYPQHLEIDGVLYIVQIVIWGDIYLYLYAVYF